MTNLLDRQNVFDNLTAIETTAKLLVNALTTRPGDTELCFNEVQQEELIHQSQTFLTKARQVVLNAWNNLNVPKDKLFEKTNGTSSIDDVSHNGSDENKPSSSTKSFSLSSITLDDIVQNRVTVKDLFPNCSLLQDSHSPNLASLVRNLRQIDSVHNMLMKAYTKIFNHDERICCNYKGINGKLPYPRHKQLLFDRLIKLILAEREKIFDDSFFTKCEKHFSSDTPSLKYRGVNIDHLKENNHDADEKQFICTIFRLVVPSENVKQILAAKQDLTSQWNENDICIYYVHPIYLLWIKQKWLEQFPTEHNDEAQRWSQCIDWAIESFLEKNKVRPSKRKTMEVSTDHKRAKPSITLEEELKQIDRTKFNVYEFATRLLQHISSENNQTLPTFEQLRILESSVIRFYWTPDQEETWYQILDLLAKIFLQESNEHFRQTYSKNLIELNPTNQMEIERLLQITI